LKKYIGDYLSSGEKENLESVIEDLAKMLRSFVNCRMYTFVDKLANAASKEVILSTIYEALRVAKSAVDSGRPLCEKNGVSIRAYVAKESSVKVLMEILDEDLEKGLEFVKKISVRSLSFPERGGG